MTRDTRTRIVEAVRALHEEVGPARTTITAIAERAGVQRLTVYRHFPDDAALIQACSADWREDHPAPDPASWMGEPDPEARLRTALARLYAYFRDGGAMLEKVLRDEGEVPELAAVLEPWWAYLDQVAAGLAAGWGVSGGRQRELRAAVGLAVRFSTWRALEREGLDPEGAAGLMTRLVACSARGARNPRAPRS